ncbi:MAG TPA: amino acid adenylation domain-containing protein [Gammaproteobacteria bacterium]|nr:amino acid adenylation domain-containing protein [Gammaproteobacteria bacterium]
MKAREFWGNRLSNFSSPTPLVIDTKATRGVRDLKIKEVCLSNLSDALPDAFKEPESLFCAVWGLILSRYSAEDDVLFGLNANKLFTEQSPVPMCVNGDGSLSIMEYAESIEKYLSEINDSVLISLDEYQSLSGIPASEQLFESVLIINPQSRRSVDEISNQYSLCLLVENNAALCVELYYDATRFSETVISRLCGHIEVILQRLSGDPASKLQDICLLSEEEKELVLDKWNETSIEYPDDKCLHQLFEQQVEQHADNTAVIFESESLTYRELNKRSNQLAHYLVEKGAGPGKLIAISLKRGINMVTGLMAVSKSGAAYVPLDPGYPDDRLVFMLEDTQAPILLTESSLLEGFPAHEAETILIDEQWPQISTCNHENVDAPVSAKDLAYVIYTSGSTGRPKGAILNHQGRVNNFCDFNRRYNIGAGDRLLGLASISFDMSVYDVFGTLGCGGCLVVADSTSTQGAANWSRLMLKHGITVWHSVPALMEMLIDYVEEKPEVSPDKLRLVLLGGDWIPVALPDRIKALVETVQVVSMGGATECSMDSTIYDINEASSDWKSIPYGFPMANQLTYVLDANLQPVPVGVAGELHLGGVGVGEGYLNREDLTAEKFIANPFRAGERIYKTGDLARFTEDGNLELLGRIDFQVKIRGFRVELGEIESSLRQHPAVKECVILAKQDSSKMKRLVAYVLPDNEYEDVDIDETEEEQVEQWQSVYDSAYSKAKDLEDETFNIVSWDSSYTSEPYSEEIMRTWVNSTVDRICRHKPDKVLEIGCGTGLLLLRIAPQCSHYLGTDISPVALEHVAQQKEKLNLTQIELQKRSGEDFTGIKKQHYDMVVLNSIVMDFPNLEYLTEVIAGAIKAIKPGGVFFIGDVRDQNTVEAFHASVQLFRARSSSAPGEIRQTINRQLSVEEEMLIEPEYFAALKEKIPEITGVNIQFKRGNSDNEMTKFRYDVTLFTGNEKIESAGDYHNWDSGSHDLDGIRELLTQAGDSLVVIRDMPNFRTAEDYLTIENLGKNKIQTISELRKTVKQAMKDYPGLDPEKLWVLAAECGFELEVHYSQNNNAQCFDAVFKPEAYLAEITTDIKVDKNRSLDSYANNPLQSKIRRKMVTKLRKHLDNQLPSYMLPSAFIIMDKFPLSPNGKLNRKALPEPDNLRPELEESYLAPRNDLETVLSDIWSECLHIEQVGVNDGFIALGGNSLTATQVVSRIRDLFQVELPISYGFNATLDELAQQLEGAGRKADIDVQETASVYLQVSNMSESEIREMLN